MKDKIILKNNNKKRLNKYKNECIETIILKDDLYYGDNEFKNNIEIKNHLIDYKKTKFYIYNARFRYHNLKSKNIYFKNTDNLGGLTLSHDYLLINNISFIDLYWDPEEDKISNIKEINVITSNKITKINLRSEELENIEIKVNKNNIEIDAEHINFRKIYDIDKDGNIKEEIIYYIITEKDLVNGVLDLTKFKEFDPIKIMDINIDTLILNKNDICKIQYINLYDNVYIKNIKVVDDNQMKLNPNTIIPFNDELDFYEEYIISNNEKVLIYVNENNVLKLFDKDKLLNDNRLSDIIFSYDSDDIIIIYKYKKLGKYKIIINDKEYNIDKLFTIFIKENLSKYDLTNEIKNTLNKYDWITLINEKISGDQFINMYNDYLEFKRNLNKLHKLGLSYKYFMYLHQRNLDSTINEMCKNPSSINNYSRNEINDLNELGKKYVKKLKK